MCELTRISLIDYILRCILHNTPRVDKERERGENSDDVIRYYVIVVIKNLKQITIRGIIKCETLKYREVLC